MTNQLFAPTRFTAYFIKFCTENRIKLLINYCVMFIAPVFFFSFIPYVRNPYWATISFDPMHQIERDIYVWMLIFFTLGAGSAVYDFLKSKTARISTFTCPASSLEKFSVWFLVWIVGLTAILLFGIFFGDAIRVWLFKNSPMVSEGAIVNYISPSYLLSLGHNVAYPAGFSEGMIESMRVVNRAEIFLFYSFCFFSMSVFALGATLWPKNNIFKTIGASIALNMLFVFATYLGFKILLPGMNHTSRYEADITEAQLISTAAVILLTISVFFWILGYVRMKEWEVIKRW